MDPGNHSAQRSTSRWALTPPNQTDVPDNYQVVKRLGEGTFGYVVAAKVQPQPHALSLWPRSPSSQLPGPPANPSTEHSAKVVTQATTRSYLI